MKEYGVNREGRMTLPVAARKHWEVLNRVTKVQIANLGEGALVIPDGTEWAMVEAYCPDSELQKHATVIYKSYEPRTRSRTDGELTRYPNGVFDTYKMNRDGMITVPAQIRRAWGILPGGALNATDLKSAILLTPRDSNLAPDDLVPVDMLEDGGWEYNRGGALTLFLMKAYIRWTSELGRELAETAFNGGEYSGIKPERDETALGLKVAGFVLRSTLQSALEYTQAPGTTVGKQQS